MLTSKTKLQNGFAGKLVSEETDTCQCGHSRLAHMSACLENDALGQMCPCKGFRLLHFGPPPRENV